MVSIDEHQFMIEHYQSIIFLSDLKIVIQLKKKQIEITGTNLYIDYFSHYEIRGKGTIEQVRFTPCH